jgi:protein-tyrosine phosphatase
LLARGTHMFRSIELPDHIPGKIYLHSMPGYYEKYELAFSELSEKKIQTVISFTSLDEIRMKSPDYAKAIEAGSLPFTSISFPIRDFSVPDDREAYLRLVKETAGSIMGGESVLVHCAAGIGRTGMFAASVLLALGLKKPDALARVWAAESEPEITYQAALVDWVAKQFS